LKKESEAYEIATLPVCMSTCLCVPLNSFRASWFEVIAALSYNVRKIERLVFSDLVSRKYSNNYLQESSPGFEAIYTVHSM
jgi:hypothetical protein